MFSYSFMRMALLGVLLIAPMFGLLGTMAVNNRMAFFSDALGHSALTGLALGVILGISDQTYPLLAFGIAWAVLLIHIKARARASTDTIIGVFSATAIALGLVLLSHGGGFARYSTFLVGDILSITTGDLWLLLGMLVVVIVAWALVFNRLLLTSINVSLAASRGIRVRLMEYLFVILLALAVMLSIRWVGTMLVNSLLVLPAAAARNLSRSIRQYTLWSVGLALCSGVLGLVLSYWFNTAAGASIVLVSAILYFGSLVVKRRR